MPFEQLTNGYNKYIIHPLIFCAVRGSSTQSADFREKAVGVSFQMCCGRSARSARSEGALALCSFGVLPALRA